MRWAQTLFIENVFNFVRGDVTRGDNVMRFCVYEFS